MLRLLTFRPRSPGDVADQFLRAELLPGLVDRTGIDFIYAARGLTAGADLRIVVSGWLAEHDRDKRDGAHPVALAEMFDFEAGEIVADPAVEVHDLDFAVNFERDEQAQILRVFRGRAVSGRLDEYVEQARVGTLADAAAEHGPLALYLARTSEDEFVTVSVWSSWEKMVQATGGNIRDPMATRHAHLLESGTADHYEIVPSTIAGRAQRPESV